MQIHIYKTPELAAKAAATLIAAAILAKNDAVIGLPTGSSPVATYRELARMNKEGVLDFSRVITFNLDEYMGLAGDHPQSYRHFMNENLFDHINIAKENTHVPSGIGDGEANARAYEEAIAATGVIALTPSTIEANSRFFASAGEVPRAAISMGVGTIMRARRTLLIATGADKADAVYGLVRGAITPSLPASALRLHPHCVVLLDEDAASRL